MRPTDPISGNASDAKRKKKGGGDGLTTMADSYHESILTFNFSEFNISDLISFNLASLTATTTATNDCSHVSVYSRGEGVGRRNKKHGFCFFTPPACFETTRSAS